MTICKITEFRNAQKTRNISKKDDSNLKTAKLDADRSKEASSEDFHSMLSKLLQNDGHKGVSSVLVEYAPNFIPKELLVPIPQPMSNLFQEQFIGKYLPKILKKLTLHFRSTRLALSSR